MSSEMNEQSLTDIQNLQNMEKEMFQNLEAGLANNTLNSQQKDTIINKINEISQIRTNLYYNMNGLNSAYQDNVSSTRNVLRDQMVAIDIVEQELNEAKRRLKLIRDEKYNKLRLVEINAYYSEQYSAHAQIMKTVIFTCIPILILSLLASRGILPRQLFIFLVVIIFIIGLISIARQVISTSHRNPMNYNEFNWYFNPANANTTTTSAPSSSSNPWATPSLSCVGTACCSSGLTYDATQNQCILPTQS